MIDAILIVAGIALSFIFQGDPDIYDLLHQHVIEHLQ